MLYLEVAVAEVDREALLPRVRHLRTVGVNGDGSISPARAIKPLLLQYVVLLLAQSVVQTST